jgi:hypothetical protein
MAEGFNMKDIGELNGENINTTFNEVFNYLRLRARK